MRKNTLNSDPSTIVFPLPRLKSKLQEEEKRNQNQVSLMELLIVVLRKSMVSRRIMEQQQSRDGGDDDAVSSVEIGWPTNVRHITHVTFDRFWGFLGLPIEFQVEVPVKAPSASGN